MHIEDLKFWHWTIIGLLAGLIFGGVKLWQGAWFDVEGLETMDQPSFDRQIAGLQTSLFRRDRQLIDIYHADQPMLKNLVVHPPVEGEPTHSYWVTGKYYRIFQEAEKPGDASSRIVNKEDWVPFRYRAAVPYHATAAVPGTYPTVAEFLSAVKKKYPDSAASRFAWWEQPMPTILLPAAAGLLIIGIAWPLALGLMQGAGLARAPSQTVKLPKQRNLSGKAKAPKDHSADDQKLADLNAQMDKALAGYGASSASSISEDSRAPAKLSSPKVLPGAGAAPAAPPSKEEISRQYGGVFYPVVKKDTPKKKE